MRILILDQSRERMVFVRRALASRLPDIEVTEYDAEQRGKPPASFDWSLYDLVILNDDLGAGISGIRWLREFRSQPGFPPAVVIVDLGDTSEINRASWGGADAVIGHTDLNAGNLLAALKAALARSIPEEAGEPESLPGDRTPNQIEELLKQDTEGQLQPHFEYTGLRLIGQGGMSRVYLAERVADGQSVVLKLLETESAEPEQLQRFIHEAELISSLDSPYVVKIFERAFTNRYGFIAMEFFSRGDLKQRIEHGIAPGDALLYLLQIAYALVAIHDVGIVHRDLKPANIMFRGDDSLALADFGVSKRMDLSSELTAPGTILGTLYYMSPEQVEARHLDSRSDLYSLGVLFFEMLTGRKPFVGSSPSQLLDLHLSAEIPRLPPESRSFQAVLNRLLAKAPEDRFQTAADLIDNIWPACRALQVGRAG